MASFKIGGTAMVAIKYIIRHVALLGGLLMLVSCGYATNKVNLKREVQLPKTAERPVSAATQATPEALLPDFSPASEDISPLKTRIVDISARNTPLRDVLLVIAESCGLNLVMEQGVDPEIKVTLSLRNISAEDALQSVFSSVDYFYVIKDNMLSVRAVETRMFEIGQPSVNKTFSVDTGGDILGSTVKGNISQKIEGDASAFKYWDGIEANLKTILGNVTTGAAPVNAPVKASEAQQGDGDKPAKGDTVPFPAEALPSSVSVPQQFFTVNRLSGTIIVSASRKKLDKIEQYLATVKKVMNRQVMIEARIIEVQLNDSLKFGVDWSFIDRFGDFGMALKSQNFAGSAILGGQPITTAAIAGNKFSSLLSALEGQGEVLTLSNPRVSIMNGQTSLLSVGRNVKFLSEIKTTTNTQNGVLTTTVDTKTDNILSGVIVGIVPFISDNGDITMNITPIITDLVSQQERVFGQNSITLPTVDLRELSTTVKVRDGEMVVIGGLISKKENMVDNKVPLLGDIPWLGTLLFTQKTKENTKSELVVILQPVIVSK
jgi:MSHA type pilus biogenesis protein MshL